MVAGGEVLLGARCIGGKDLHHLGRCRINIKEAEQAHDVNQWPVQVMGSDSGEELCSLVPLGSGGGYILRNKFPCYCCMGRRGVEDDDAGGSAWSNAVTWLFWCRLRTVLL